MSHFGYMERQIEGLSRFLAKTLFHKDVPSDSVIDEHGDFSMDSFLQHMLLQMVAEGRINEAEDLLFEKMEANPQPEYLQIALAFYERVQQLDDRALAACNFSREEIAEGLTAVKKLVAPDA